MVWFTFHKFPQLDSNAFPHFLIKRQCQCFWLVVLLFFPRILALPSIPDRVHSHPHARCGTATPDHATAEGVSDSPPGGGVGSGRLIFKVRLTGFFETSLVLGVVKQWYAPDHPAAKSGEQPRGAVGATTDGPPGMPPPLCPLVQLYGLQCLKGREVCFGVNQEHTTHPPAHPPHTPTQTHTLSHTHNTPTYPPTHTHTCTTHTTPHTTPTHLFGNVAPAMPAPGGTAVCRGHFLFWRGPTDFSDRAVAAGRGGRRHRFVCSSPGLLISISDCCFLVFARHLMDGEVNKHCVTLVP